MIVREAGPDDATAVRVVAAAAWRATYTGLLSGRTIDTFVDAAYSIDRLLRRIDRHTFLVVEDAGSIIAFADATLVPDARDILVEVQKTPVKSASG